MHGAAVERILRPLDPEETGALLEGFLAQAGHLHELPAGLVAACLGTVSDDVVGQCGADAGHVLQQVRAGRIQVHAHAVHAAFHRIVQLLVQERLVHIVLVLADSQGFRVDLHQFGQRVHQAAADGDRAADGHVLVGELLPGHVRRGIHGSAILAHGEDPDAVGETHLADEFLRLAAGRAVANGDHFNPVPFHQVRDRHDGLDLLGSRRMRENDRMVQQAAVFVQADDLAARPEARIDGQRPLLPHRCRE